MGEKKEIEEKRKKKNTPEGAEKTPQKIKEKSGREPQKIKEKNHTTTDGGKEKKMKKCNVGILEAKTKEGKFYLSVVVDKESRYVLGHATSCADTQNCPPSVVENSK